MWARIGFGRLLLNSVIVAVGIAAGKLAISLLSAFAITYFRFRFRQAAFWLIFLSLMLPVEVRIVPTFEAMTDVLMPLRLLVEGLGIGRLWQGLTGWRLEVSANWSLLNSYGGLIFPLMASATATFLFRQFFLTIPDELAEAAKLDGAGPLRFLRDVVLPLSRNSIAALFVILFIYGWNQYLWPLLIVTDRSLDTIVVGLSKSIGTGDSQNEWNTIMALAVLALLPPVAVVVAMQRWFVRGLTETEK